MQLHRLTVQATSPVDKVVTCAMVYVNAYQDPARDFQRGSHEQAISRSCRSFTLVSNGLATAKRGWLDTGKSVESSRVSRVSRVENKYRLYGTL